MTFYKVRRSGGSPCWFTLEANACGMVWVNFKGGWCTKRDDDEVLAKESISERTTWPWKRRGWIRVFKSVELRVPVYCQPRTTSAQIAWLEDKGIPFHCC